MQYQSNLEEREFITQWPDFTGERIYMREFFQKDGLPDDINRWQPIVNSMLYGVETDKPIYLMVDQGDLKAGQFHRRSGLHIDGYWCSGKPKPGWTPFPPTHSPISAGHRGHLERPYPSHRGHSGGHIGWGSATFKEPEAIILASNVSACRGLQGTFEGPIGEGGDCSHLKLNDMTSIVMVADRVYAGNVTMVHETLPVQKSCQRTVVRLNVPGYTVNVH